MNFKKKNKYYNDLREAEIQTSKDFFKKLQESFPQLWKTENWPDKRLSTGKGWNRLIWSFSEAANIINTSIEHLVPTCNLATIVGVKQKLGNLRIHTDANFQSPILRKKYTSLVNMIEAQSAKICEHCGTPGQRRHHYPELADVPFGWLVTLCNECWVITAEDRALGVYDSGATSHDAKKLRKWLQSRINKVNERIGNVGS